jgi:hypothetical protein
MQYIRNGDELRTESFQLGAIVVGNIRISVNDVAINYIGDTPNLVGNLLNEGNTPALFTKIELLEPGAQGTPQLLRPTVSSQFLGDLAVNSPLPFSIPLQIMQQNITQEVTGNSYPISLKITYSDELRNTHEVILNRTVSYSPPQQEEEAPNQGFLGFGSSTAESSSTNFVLPLVLIFAAIGAAAAVVIIIVMRRRSRTKKISRLMGSQENNDDFDASSSSDEYLGSSSEDESSRKQ